jgi:hypothetical protein
MAEKKEESFKVSDRRLFTADGELRAEEKEEVFSPPKPQPTPDPMPKSEKKEEQATGSVPPPPSAAEQQEQADAYRKSSSDFNKQAELHGHSSKDLEMTFERFLASLYMTAMLQLGLMHEQGGQPQIDIIGARQTIDTISLLSEKTKGNLSPVEENFMQNALYELRMAYVEVANALSRPPQPTAANAKR